ncbi:MAG: DUF4123 domain-containing protein [Motiliproteus sp.]
MLKALYQHHLAPEYALLYQDTVYQGLNEVSPVLCAIEPEDALWQLLVNEWPQQQAVVLLRSTCDLSELQHHLARLISVEAAGSGRCDFRFYEPAIAEFLFPALTPAQFEQMLGPVSAWVWPWALSGTLVEWHGITRAKAPVLMDRFILDGGAMQALARMTRHNQYNRLAKQLFTQGLLTGEPQQRVDQIARRCEQLERQGVKQIKVLENHLVQQLQHEAHGDVSPALAKESLPGVQP